LHFIYLQLNQNICKRMDVLKDIWRHCKDYFHNKLQNGAFYLFADDFGYCEYFIAEESEMQYQVPLSGQWVIDSSFSIPIVDFDREVVKIKRKYKRQLIESTERRLSRVAKNLPATWRLGRLAQRNGDPLAAKSSNENPETLQPVVDLGDRLESKIQKKRGRKPKVKVVAVTPKTFPTTENVAIPKINNPGLETQSNVENVVVVTEKKKRGRPPKSILKEKSPCLVPDSVPAVVEKRKPGRPSKASLLLASPASCNGHPTEPVPRNKPGPKPKTDSQKTNAVAEYPPNFLQRAVQRLRIIERDNRFYCNKCGRAFKQKQRCLSHQNVHRSWYKCLKCNKSYINKRFLVHHEMIAHQGKQFKKK
jgi:hypothetical protein